jgi:DNA-directed RNA polymerase subunit RPC12/RpoP
MQQTINCPSCGSAIAGGQKFCGVCGLNMTSMMQPRATACPTCNTPISPGQQFCGVCGTNVASISQQQPPMAQPGQTIVAMPKGGATPIASMAPTAMKQVSTIKKRRFLSAAAVIFQIFGWIILIGGVLISLAMAVFAGMGGTFMPVTPGATAFGGEMALGMAICGVIASLLYGFGFLAFAELCLAVIDIEKKLK